MTPFFELLYGSRCVFITSSEFVLIVVGIYALPVAVTAVVI